MPAVPTEHRIWQRAFLRPAVALALVIALAGPVTPPAVAEDGWRSVSGTVSLPADAPMDWLKAIQVSAQPVTGLGFRSAQVDPVTGAYALTDLEPGPYRIQFSVNAMWNGSRYERPNLVGEYYDNAPDWNSATAVDLSAASAVDIDVQLATGRSISGRITLPEGADPAWLGAVSVNASAANGGSANADVDPVTGDYTITGLAPDSYHVQFTVGTYWDGTASVRPNLVSEYYDDATEWGASTPIDVTADNKSGVDATLESGRSITGTVALPDGAPSEWLRSISVTATEVDGSIIGGSGAALDPASGEYRITGLAPGFYHVSFRVMNTMPGAETPNLVDEYYSDVYTPSDATPIDVTEGDKEGINAAMEPGRSISGTISLPADAPTAWRKSIGVSVMTPSGEFLNGGSGNLAVDAETGAYTFSRLPAGEFILHFSASGYSDGSQWVSTDIASEYYDDAVSRADATLVSTATGDVTGIDGTLEYGGGIDMDLDVSSLLGTGNGIGISITDLDGNILNSYGDPLPHDGHYPVFMSNLAPGQYRVAVTTSTWDEQMNLATVRSAQFLRFGTGTSVSVTAGDTVTGSVSARATDSSIGGEIRAEGFLTTGSILGSALPYEKLDGGWVRIPDVRFDATQNGNRPYAVAVPAGTYTMGYETDYSTSGVDTDEEWWSKKSTLADADVITLASGQSRTGINGTIHPEGVNPDGVRSVSGVVSLPAGAPAGWLGAVQVSAQPVNGPGFRSVPVDPVTGAYALTDLAPGSYRIQFSVNQFWNGTEFLRPNLVSEYYSDATDWNSATVIDLTGGSLTNIDAQLATGQTIKGHVTLPAGADPAWWSSIAVSASSLTGASGYTQVDPVTGDYAITGLPSGMYQVLFTVGTYWNGTTSVKPNLVSEYYDDAIDWSSATPVDVSAGDRSDIDATLEPGRSITGKVTLPAGAPPDWLNSVSVTASALDGSMVGGLGANPDPDTGEYVLTGLAPGVYHVLFRVMSTGMPGAERPNLVDEYYNNANTLSTATPVDVGDDDASGIDAALESGRSISGRISLPSDAPDEWMEAARILLYAPDGEYLSYGNNAKVDAATGAYTIPFLPPGEFLLQFSASSYFDGTDWNSTDIAPEYYDDAATRDDATAVSTSSGNATGIDAALGHGGALDLDVDVTALVGTGSGIGISITDLDGNMLTSYGDPLPEDGHYPIAMGNLTPGSYRIALTTTSWDEATSRSTVESAQFLRFGPEASVSVGAGKTITGTVAARAADATITGTFSAEGFATAADTLGSALAYEKLDGQWVRLPDVRFDVSQNGATPYRVTVPAGTYTMGYEAVYATSGVQTEEQWWNNQRTLAAATPIALTAGQKVTSIDGKIKPARARTVERTAGVDRYATSAAVSAATFEPGTPVAYLANGEKFPDALS
ncbi:carboxypeptidase regulatory-like domain-containing protein, partial [Microbacterium jejuense]